MPSASDVRKIALALDGVSEVYHWNRPSYRTKKRIFAVMRPDGLYLNLPERRREFLFQAAPEVFVKFMWQDRECDRADRHLSFALRFAAHPRAALEAVQNSTQRPGVFQQAFQQRYPPASENVDDGYDQGHGPLQAKS
jgi:hypothetical protein